MNIALPLLTFLIPIFGIISGLTASVLVPIFIIMILFTAKNRIIFSLQNHGFEIIFLLWLAISCLWSPEIINSISAFSKIFAITGLGALSCANVQSLKYIKPRIELSIISSAAIALALFFIELSYGGVISSVFRQMFQNENNQSFHLHFLDRGCVILALSSWLVIGLFLKYNHYKLAITYYFFVIFTLYFSDNMAGFVSFSLSGSVFLITRNFQFLRNPKVVGLIVILISFLMIIFFVQMDPKSIADRTESLPLSAKHRLFIWNFVASKTLEHPFTGFGFSSSKSISSKEQGFVEYDGVNLSLFPLHPHNNILQILLETGLVGLILFLTVLCKYIFYIGRNYQTDNILRLNMISTCYSCFATYMGVAMLSYSIWQSWWVCIVVWVIIMIYWLLLSVENK